MRAFIRQLPACLCAKTGVYCCLSLATRSLLPPRSLRRSPSSRIFCCPLETVSSQKKASCNLESGAEQEQTLVKRAAGRSDISTSPTSQPNPASQIRLCCPSLMRLAFSLRLRRSLLMPLNLPKPSSPLASPSASSSRPYAQQTNPVKQSASPKRTSDFPSAEEPPAKMHKVDQGSAGSSRQPFRGGGRGAGSSLLARAHKNNASNANASSRGGRRKGKNTPNLPPLPGPLHDEDYITKTYRTKPLKKIHETNPKSPLNNFIMNNSGGQMEFQATHGVVEGVDQAVWR